jgi:uncharacterized membrane protein YjjB (DUF3815 family)
MTEYFIQILAAFVGTVGFAVLYNIRGVRFVFASLGGLISWSSYLLLNCFLSNEILCYFLVALLISLYSEIMARVLKTPTTTFIIISLIPLIPGSSLYYTMTGAFSGDLAVFASKAAHTLGLAGALAAGIITVAGLARFFVSKRK